MQQSHSDPTTTDRAQTADDLQDVIDATESVNWRDVPEVSTADVSRWAQKLEFARKTLERDGSHGGR